MGSSLLSFTIKELHNKPSLIWKIRNKANYFSSSDIDLGNLWTELLPAFLGNGKRATLYASDKDKALHISEAIRRGLPRLGEAGECLFVAEGVDTIDASNVKSQGISHSYIFEEQELLSDVSYC